MATSGTYNFYSLPSGQIIVDAYNRIGILEDVITGQQIETAQRSLNYLLQEWINKGLNLWTVKQSLLGLNPNQNAYTLPIPTSDVLEANIRQTNRQLGGTAFSSAGGVAQNAFDGNPLTACTQTAPDGYISYFYGATTLISVQMVGIQSNATLTYTLSLDYSFDNVTWTTAATETAQSYAVGQIVWFIIPTPVPAQYFRVRETGGATLNVQELYFNNNILDIPITRISRSEYIALPNKNQTGRPSSFWVDRQINPVIYLWPTPVAPYNSLFYTRVGELQDVGTMLDNAEIPSRFFEAITAGLSFKLAQKFTPDRIEMLKALYEEAFNHAAREDSERVPLRIYGDYTSGWTQT